MNVLVTAASRHGATAGIVAAISARLREHGLTVTNLEPADIRSLAGYDAVVIGSGVYIGRWMKEARELVERTAPELASRRVWLFSSGPLGDPPVPAEDPADVAEMLRLSGAVEHRLFAGRIDRSALGVRERAIVRMVKAPEGDFRDWDGIAAWADQVAHQLQTVATT